MVWNRSTFYAISVGHLADRFVGGGPIINMPSVEERPLSRNEVIELQGLLNAQGIDAGTPDGIMGSRTRAAIRTFQEKANIPTDGYANFDLLETIRNF
ncbi:MAG: peptidoglycan-binding protein [Pseudohongiellaceae bacterium]